MFHGGRWLPEFWLVVPDNTQLLDRGCDLQPRFPRAGIGLMLAGTLWLSFWVLPYGVVTLRSYSKIDRLDTIAIVLVSVLLVTLCDVALVIEEMKIRRI